MSTNSSKQIGICPLYSICLVLITRAHRHFNEILFCVRSIISATPVVEHSMGVLCSWLHMSIWAPALSRDIIIVCNVRKSLIGLTYLTITCKGESPREFRSFTFPPHLISILTRGADGKNTTSFTWKSSTIVDWSHAMCRRLDWFLVRCKFIRIRRYTNLHNRNSSSSSVLIYKS